MRSVEAVSATRLRTSLADAARIDAGALEAAGVTAAIPRPGGLLDLIVGLEAAAALARIAKDQGTLAEDLAQARGHTRELERDLAHGKRLAVLGRVVAGVVHEVRNPITGIKLTLEGLTRRGLDARSLRDVGTCLQELVRLDRVVGSLLLVARSGVEHKTELDLARVVDERLRQAEAPASARRVTLVRTGTAQASCSSDMIARVLDNLVRNAIDASPEGGEVCVRLQTDGQEVRIAVEDQGAGVPPDREHELFEPFFTLKPEGTGLGLFLSRALVVAQGGRLTYAPGASSTSFVVTLPQGHPEDERATRPPR